MPIYEYQCAKCGHHHEALQKLSDPPLRKCPDCGRQALTRLVSAVRFRLSGSGWYETDFKSEQENRRNLAERGDDAPADKDKGQDKKPDEAAAAPAKAEPAAGQPETRARKTVAVSRPVGKSVPARKSPAKAAARRKTAARPAKKTRR
jgi:putative FmdB family regulatory protein